MTIDQENYIKELKRKNEKALNYVYKNYSGLAYKLAFDVLKDVGTKEDVEECVSDIFVGLWNNINKYDENITTFKKWFIAISKYKAIDYKRRLSNKVINIELNEEQLAKTSNIEDKVIMEENMETLEKLINDMKDVDKQIFIKRYILNEDIQDISKSLGFSRSIVDNRLSRGRKSIKNKWLQLMGR